MNETDDGMNNDESERPLEGKLARARAVLEHTERALEGRGAPPIAGDILFQPGDDTPEWLVVVEADSPQQWLVVALEDEHRRLVLDDEIAGVVALDPAEHFTASTERLRTMTRAGVLSDTGLQTVRNALPSNTTAPSAPLRWIGLAAAAVILAAIAVALWPGHRRSNPGLYALRDAAGEVGAELRIGDRVCRARGVLDAPPCGLDGTPVSVEYRLDEGMRHRYAVVFRVDGATRRLEHATSEPLAPTTTDSSERCERGFCPLARVSADAGELFVVFLRDPPPATLPDDHPASWPGALPYRFELTAP